MIFRCYCWCHFSFGCQLASGLELPGDSIHVTHCAGGEDKGLSILKIISQFTELPRSWSFHAATMRVRRLGSNMPMAGPQTRFSINLISDSAQLVFWKSMWISQTLSQCLEIQFVCPPAVETLGGGLLGRCNLHRIFYLLVSSFVRVWSLKIKSGPQSSSRGEGKPGKYMCTWKHHLQVARFTFSCPAGSTRKAEEGQRIGEVGRFLPSVS